MRRRLRFGRFTVLFTGLLLAGLFGASSSTAYAQQSDVVTSSVDIRLDRMLLLLRPSAAQQKALDTLLAAQQTRGNVKFHRWLTPSEYASQFAPSAADAAAIASWLRARGFSVASLPASHGWIEFSGTAAQLQRAFGASVKPVASGDALTRYQLSGALTLPSTIAAKVQGLVSLDGVQAVAATTTPSVLASSVEALAAATSVANAPALTPALAATTLHLSASLTGSGEIIAIPTRSNVRPEDFAAFRKSFGLPGATLAVHADASTQASTPARNSDEAAAIEAASWAGLAAPDAQILLVPVASTNATDGLDLALAATIDQALAHTVSVGYTACESSLSPSHQAFYAALYRQAAAEGIAVIAATGDSGAAACHSASDATPIRTGYAVNALAATPWNTAVGAVAFVTKDPNVSSTASTSLTGWHPSSTTDPAYATGGGASTLYATPAWQSASGLPSSDPGTPAAHHRYLPDISLPTAATRGLVFCFTGDSEADSNTETCHVVRAGGSAASTAIFAGIAAQIAQKYGPQGNLAPNLYTLRQAEVGAQTPKSAPDFSDITAGNARLQCTPGTPDCDDTGEIGFSASAGYDLASGLGSVNGTALLRDWANPAATGTTPATVEMTNVNGLTYNPSADIALNAKVLSGSGGTIPTGTVQFYDESTGGNTGTPVTLAADGTATYTEPAQFSIGGHNIAAIYSGDSTYAAGESQPITINIQPSATSLVISPSTSTPAAGTSITVTGTVTSPNPGDSPPTGSLTVNLDGLSQGTQRFTTTAGVTTASVTVTAPSGGSHVLQGTYSGDINYSNSTSPSVTIAVAKSASVTGISASPATLATGVPEAFTATVAPLNAVTGTTYVLTGTVSFYDGGTTLLGTATVSSNTAILAGVNLSATASHTITAVYSGDTSYTTSTSSPLLLTSTLLPVTVTLTESSTAITPDQPVTLTAMVTPVSIPPVTAEQHPSGYVLFYAGGTLVSPQVPVLESGVDSGVASWVVSNLAAGQYVITAQYSGDPTYGAAASNSLNLVAQDFTITCSAANINMVQGTTQNVTCAVASLGGLTGPIQVACAEQNPPQNGAINCSFNPNVIENSGSTTLTVVTKAGNIAQNRQQPGSPFWPAAGGSAALAFAGVLLSPIGRRARWVRQASGKLLVLALLLAGLASAGIGCGTNTVTLSGNGGTPLGVHTLKITAGAYVGTVTVTHNAYLTVNVTP